MPDLQKLRLRFKPAENVPANEWLWAAAVDVHDLDIVFRLENSSFLVPLAAGDLVTARVAAGNVMQVTGLLRPSDMILTVVGAPPGSDMDLEPVAEDWSAKGARWTEGRAGLLVTVWSPGTRLDAIEAALQPALEQGLHWHATAEPAFRIAENMPEVDFELDPNPPVLDE